MDVVLVKVFMSNEHSRISSKLPSWQGKPSAVIVQTVNYLPIRLDQSNSIPEDGSHTVGTGDSSRRCAIVRRPWHYEDGYGSIY